MQKRLSILSVCWYKIYPPLSGGQNGIVYFNEALAKKEQLTCICSKNNSTPENDPVRVIPVLGTSKLQFLQRKQYRKIIEQILLLNPSIVLIENPYYFLLYLWKKKYAFEFWVHTHNIEYLRAKQNGKWFWPLIKIVEKIAYRKADKIICKTDADAQILLEQFQVPIVKIFVFPYCTNITALPNDNGESNKWLKQQYQLGANTKILLFSGSFNYTPNQQALLHLIFTILPVLKKQISVPFKIIICGLDVDTFLLKNKLVLPDDFLVLGFVNDINLYYKAADLFINPVQTGQGMQTKNIDAIANNCTVVGYNSVGNGMPKDLLGKKIFLTEPNEPATFVKNILIALERPLVTTPETFYQNYSWPKRVEDLFAQY